jgi:hypothetical protein
VAVFVWTRAATSLVKPATVQARGVFNGRRIGGRRGSRLPWSAAGVDRIDDSDGRVEGNAMEKVMWLVLGATVIVASLFADRSSRARLVARVALGVLFLVFGAMVNVVYLITAWDSFAEFGEMSQFAFVRDTWASLVAPNTGLFIGALIIGEAIAGILVLSGGRRLEAGLVLLLAFHVGLLFFGWWLWLYAVPMLGALTLLLRAERRHPQGVTSLPHGVERGSTPADTIGVVGGGADPQPSSRRSR